MDKALLDLASESVFCSEPATIRFAETIKSSTLLAMAMGGTILGTAAFLYYSLPKRFNKVPVSALWALPPLGVGIGYLGAENKKDKNSESFELAYSMKCNYCSDDERCQNLYGPEWECVDGKCMEIVEEENDDD
mgnify:CR=1 FL=1|tara:strand:- start:1792 stop:2193 length:402 start_codon:yes stop_codon:yes gene_type:complete